MVYGGDSISGAEWFQAELRDIEEKSSSSVCERCDNLDSDQESCPKCCGITFEDNTFECVFCEYHDECLENNI